MNSPLPPFPLPHQQLFTVLQFYITRPRLHTYFTTDSARVFTKFLPKLLWRSAEPERPRCHTTYGVVGFPLACDITTKVCVCLCMLQWQFWVKPQTKCARVCVCVCEWAWVMVSLSGCLACVFGPTGENSSCADSKQQSGPAEGQMVWQRIRTHPQTCKCRRQIVSTATRTV